jgi:hypothetical protein
VGTLRDAYVGPLDAMGRYQPAVKIDYRMSVAFETAHQPDSGRVSAEYVRQARKNADPEYRQCLDQLLH